MNLPPESTQQTEPDLADEVERNLTDVIRAHFSIVQLVTHEEDRGVKLILKIAKSLGYHPYLWSVTQGIVEDIDAETTLGARRNLLTDLKTAIDYCEKVAATRHKSLFIFLDPYPFLSKKASEIAPRRRLRELAMNIRTRGYNATCVIISPSRNVAPELQKEVTLVDLPLPDHAYITRFVAAFIARAGRSPKVDIGEDHELVHALADAAVGLTKAEIENCLAKALVHNLALRKEDVRFILEEKSQIIRKSGILEYISTENLSLEDIGGLENLKSWLTVRRLAFSADALEYGIASPRGVLLTGVPGCGKSLSAKCVAAAWGLPLISLDMGRIFSMWVGSSEENIRNALKTCEAVAPCILWIDEIEKGLAHARGGNMGDSGVTMRVLGTLTTWMQEKKAPVFIFATANEIDALPAEVLRKGRFDDIFFVDLPSAAEREAILRIHLHKHKHGPEQLDLDRLVMLSGEDHFGPDVVMTGAEMESWVNEAMITSFARGKRSGTFELTMADFESSLAHIVPLSRLRSEQIGRMREWAGDHAISASRKAEAPKLAGRRIDI